MGHADTDAVVRALVAAGESYYVEFKSAWRYGPEGREPRDIKAVARDIAEAVVAFGNADGGDLLVGVEDGGAITGIPWVGDRVQYLVGAPHSHVLGQVDTGTRVQEISIDGHRVLLFRTPEYALEPLVTVDGRCLRRQGARSEPVQPEEIGRRRAHVAGDERWESDPVPAATLQDLDLELLDWLRRFPDVEAPLSRPHRTDPRRSDRRDRPSQLELFARPAPQLRCFDTVLPMLRYWNLVEQRNGSVILKRAALLLFARDPLRWHPNNRIRIRHVHGSEVGHGAGLRTREHEAQGAIAASLHEAISALAMKLERESRRDTLFSTSQLLPSDAVQECVVNAVAHRNYAILGQAIEILLFPDRVEFQSPGRLPDPITVEDLKTQRGVHRSRNPVLMRVLRDLGWTRDQGEGFPRIFGSMRQVELHEPELEERADTFIVRLSTQSRYDPTTQAWIASYGPFGLRPDERRYVIELEEAGGSLSVDKLARRLGTSYDDTKSKLVALERRHLVWHRRGTRTFNLVQPLNVAHEQAWRRLKDAGIVPSPDLKLPRSAIEQIAGTDNRQTVDSLIERWREAGILAPAGRGQWRLGPSFRRYMVSRGE